MAVQKDPEHLFYAGFFLDAQGRFIPAVVSEQEIGITVRRFESVPTMQDVMRSTAHDVWLVFRLHDGHQVYISDETMETPEIEAIIRGPEGQESLHFAIELALQAWPDWCPDLRDDKQFTPRWFVPVTQEGTYEA